MHPVTDNLHESRILLWRGRTSGDLRRERDDHFDKRAHVTVGGLQNHGSSTKKRETHQRDKYSLTKIRLRKKNAEGRKLVGWNSASSWKNQNSLLQHWRTDTNSKNYIKTEKTNTTPQFVIRECVVVLGQREVQKDKLPFLPHHSMISWKKMWSIDIIDVRCLSPSVLCARPPHVGYVSTDVVGTTAVLESYPRPTNAWTSQQHYRQFHVVRLTWTTWPWRIPINSERTRFIRRLFSTSASLSRTHQNHDMLSSLGWMESHPMTTSNHLTLHPSPPSPPQAPHDPTARFRKIPSKRVGQTTATRNLLLNTGEKPRRRSHLHVTVMELGTIACLLELLKWNCQDDCGCALRSRQSTLRRRESWQHYVVKRLREGIVYSLLTYAQDPVSSTDMRRDRKWWVCNVSYRDALVSTLDKSLEAERVDYRLLSSWPRSCPVSPTSWRQSTRRAVQPPREEVLKPNTFICSGRLTRSQ